MSKTIDASALAENAETGLVNANPGIRAEAESGGSWRLSLGGLMWFIAAVAFATSSAGNFSAPFELVASLIFATLVILKLGLRAESILTGLVSVGVFVAIRPEGGARYVGLWHLIIFLSACHAGLWIGRKIRLQRGVIDPCNRAALAMYIVICGILLVVDVVLTGNPAIMPFLNSAVRQFSVGLTGLTSSKPLPLGMTYWSVPVLIAFVIAALIQMKLSWSRAFCMVVSGVAAIVAYFMVVGPLQSYVAGMDQARSLTEWYSRAQGPFQLQSEPISWRYALQWLAIERPQLILVILLALASQVPYWLRLGVNGTGMPQRIEDRLSRKLFVVALCAGMLGGLVSWWTVRPMIISQENLLGRRVAIMTSNILMNVPAHGSYGDRSLGMFGRLPGSLRSLGMHVDEIEEMGELSDQHEILILANLQETFNQEDREKILSWVQQKGGLLVLTDHTGDKGLRLPVNDLLSSVGLGVCFDTAKLFSLNGGFNYEMVVGSPLLSIRSPQWRGAHGYGTGGSITTQWPAIPIMQAEYGFSDPGSFTAVERGGCGNLTYDVGESLGDIPLVGYAPYGQGRVILFGDTSPFQNGAFADSHEFVRQIVGMLLPESPPPGCRWQGIVLLSGAGVAMVVLIVLPRGIRAACLAVEIAVVVWVGLSIVAGSMPRPVRLIDTPEAMIDITSCPYIGYQGWTATDIGGLEACLMRDGYTPIVNEVPLGKAVEALSRGDILFLLAPLWDIPRQDQSQIDAFLKKGGTCVVTCGFEESANSNTWLARYELGVLNIPLGSTDELTGDPNSVHLFNSWQVDVNKCEVLLKHRGKPVAVSRQVGDGELILIGDSKFFWNANLESRQTHRPGNIAFLSQLVQRARDRVSEELSQASIE